MGRDCLKQFAKNISLPLYPTRIPLRLAFLADGFPPRPRSPTCHTCPKRGRLHRRATVMRSRLGGSGGTRSAFDSSKSSVHLSFISDAAPQMSIEPMTQVVADSYGPKRIVTVLLSFFAVAALFLSVLGIYSLIAYSVSQRSHEIGVRLALGAHPRNVQRLIIKQGMKLAPAGLAGGVIAALFVARVLMHSAGGVTSVGLLYNVSAWNPLPILAVGSVIVAATLAACYIPARRAMRVDPMVALRHE